MLSGVVVIRRGPLFQSLRLLEETQYVKQVIKKCFRFLFFPINYNFINKLMVINFSTNLDSNEKSPSTTNAPRNSCSKVFVETVQNFLSIYSLEQL